MKQRLLAAVLCIGLVGSLLTGCGSEGGSASSASSALPTVSDYDFVTPDESDFTWEEHSLSMTTANRENREETVGVKITSYTGDATMIAIPETLGGMPVYSIGEAVFSKNEDLVAVYIPGVVVTVVTSAFKKCPSLEAVFIEEGVELVHNYTFSECPNLKVVDLPTTVHYVGEHSFENSGADEDEKATAVTILVEKGSDAETAVEEAGYTCTYKQRE